MPVDYMLHLEALDLDLLDALLLQTARVFILYFGVVAPRMLEDAIACPLAHVEGFAIPGID